MESLKYHPELVDTFGKLLYVMDNFMEHRGFAYINTEYVTKDKFPDDYIEGRTFFRVDEVSSFKSGNEECLTCAPMKIEVAKVKASVSGKDSDDNGNPYYINMPYGSSEYDDIVKYKWNEIPEGFIESIISTLDQSVDVSVLQNAPSYIRNYQDLSVKVIYC